mmetsp:Transcript_213/g.699  ORF Transcript_213/g.699 Transcript_213/m.699 type:complete len:233 (+) Transcript_213:252-950(+)
MLVQPRCEVHRAHLHGLLLCSFLWHCPHLLALHPGDTHHPVFLAGIECWHNFVLPPHCGRHELGWFTPIRGLVLLVAFKSKNAEPCGAFCSCLWIGAQEPVLNTGDKGVCPAVDVDSSGKWGKVHEGGEVDNVRSALIDVFPPFRTGPISAGSMPKVIRKNWLQHVNRLPVVDAKARRRALAEFLKRRLCGIGLTVDSNPHCGDFDILPWRNGPGEVERNGAGQHLVFDIFA